MFHQSHACFYTFRFNLWWIWSCGFHFCSCIVSMHLKSDCLNYATSYFRLIFFFSVLVIPDVQSSRNQWIIDVPSTITAVKGSCVVIPCIYTYPRPRDSKIILSWIGFWKRGNTIVSTNLPRFIVRQEFKKRAKLLGRLEEHNCTMLLDGVRSTDVGPFHFRIQMMRYKSFSFTQKMVSINVLREYFRCCFDHFETCFGSQKIVSLRFSSWVSFLALRPPLLLITSCKLGIGSSMSSIFVNFKIWKY